MATVTVREKEEWSNMLNKKIKAKIAILWDTNPTLEEKLRTRARAAAIKALGLGKKLEDIEKSQQALDKALESTFKVIESTLLEIGVLNEGGRWYKEREALNRESVYNNNMDQLESAIGKHAEAFYQKILAEDPVGSKIVALTEELSRVKESVWLASSTTAMKALWTSFVNKLSLEVTDMEKIALDI